MLLIIAFIWGAVNQTSSVLITEANAVIEIPVVGENPSELDISSDNPEQYRAVLDYCYYYDSSTDSYIDMTNADVFEYGREYFIRFQFVPEAGYHFDETTVYTANNEETACYEWDGKIEYGREITLWNDIPDWYTLGSAVVKGDQLAWANDNATATYYDGTNKDYSYVFLFTADSSGKISSIIEYSIFETETIAEYFCKELNDFSKGTNIWNVTKEEYGAENYCSGNIMITVYNELGYENLFGIARGNLTLQDVVETYRDDVFNLTYID